MALQPTAQLFHTAHTQKMWYGKKRVCVCECVGVSFRHRDFNRKNRESERASERRGRGGWVKWIAAVALTLRLRHIALSLSLSSLVFLLSSILCVYPCRSQYTSAAAASLPACLPACSYCYTALQIIHLVNLPKIYTMDYVWHAMCGTAATAIMLADVH